MNKRIVQGYLLHAFTASGAIFGLLALHSIVLHNYITAFSLMLTCTLIDAVDGGIARKIEVKKNLPFIDGSLIDNMSDFFTYTLVPSFLLFESNLLPPSWKVIIVSILILSSTYQFARTDAKTEDHFFLGFPSYWNIVAFFLYVFNASQFAATFIIISFSILSFIPIKFLYLTRLEHVTRSIFIQRFLLYGYSIAAIICILGPMYTYPAAPTIWKVWCAVGSGSYIILGLYFTFKDMLPKMVDSIVNNTEYPSEISETAVEAIGE